jgi:hypothetical protein
MSDVRSTLAEIKAKRIESEKLYACMSELRKPWHAPFWVLLTQLPWLYLLASDSARGRPYSVWILVGLAVLSVGGVIMHIRQRDRMWRELIKRKSPELLRELAE